MRDDQLTQIDDLAEKLVDVFLSEADPTTWNGAGQATVEMSPQVRGSRNWDMKNANQAGALAARALDLRDRLRGKKDGSPLEGDAPEKDIAKFEQKAREMIAAARGKSA